jgi:uridylate kinase
MAASGRKRGRKPGNGLGEKRKREDEYSTNPNTIKSRNRYQSLGKHELQVHAAKVADTTAVSRERKKLKKSAEFQALDEAGKKAALDDIKEQTLDSRYVHSPLQ